MKNLFEQLQTEFRESQLAVWLMVLGVLVLIFLGTCVALLYQEQHADQINVATTVPFTSSTTESSNQSYADGLATTSPNCIKYYNTGGQGPDPITNELADFTGLHPLSDFLCGENSDVASTTLADGKTLYFVDPITMGFCGSGGCTYNAFLEEKRGLVRHLRGFTWYSDAGSISTISVSQDTNGTVFGFLSFSKKGTVEVYWHESAQCGITNIYKFTATDTPILISASDSCLPGDGKLYPAS